MADHREIGAFQVNGQWATQIAYEASVRAGRVSEVALTFMNRRRQVAAFQGDREQVLSILGKRNLAAIESGAGAHDDKVKGRLGGAKLHYRAVVLPHAASGETHEAQPRDAENAIERDSLHRQSERDELREVAVGAAAATPAAAAQPTASDPPRDPAAAAPSAYAIPAELERQFIRVKDRFYFPDRSLAFVDRGTRLTADTENIEVIRGLVRIAQARGWEALRVTGTESFRGKVWREAALHAIAVNGYDPSEIERAQLARERAGPGEGVAAAKREDDAALRSEHIGRAAGAAPDLTFGSLIGTGWAPYRFREKARQSPYLRIATDQGERVLWGVDFPRALAEAQTQPQPGDRIGVQYLGKRAVTAKVPVKDQDGSVTGYKDISSQRNTWLVEKAEYFAAREARAAAIRNTDLARAHRVEAHPELVAALAWIHLAERLADSAIADPRDQDRFVSMVREGLARALERSEPAAPPRLRGVAPREPQRSEDRAGPMRAPEQAMAR
jgi:putative DNA primase/helicase